ncbi:MAG: hypothetical protein L6R41_000271 [Letrouitia leprolyta]|nr:MAG: hypothetical protein L6R41_000271 [Letrouitia leprolyta]
MGTWLRSCLDRTISAISNIHASDPITECPTSVLALLPSTPDPLIALAHSTLHTFPYDSVPVCWRRLYTDASIAKAVKLIENSLERSERHDPCREDGELSGPNGTINATSGSEVLTGDWVDEVVKVLDMAAIMAGAAGRNEIIDRLLSSLQNHLGEDGPPQRKRRRLGRERASFPITKNMEHSRVPNISYPVQSSTAPSMQAFETHMKTAQPLRIKEALTHWPAMHERPWSDPGYLLEKTFGGRRLIPVEIGRSYTDAEWGQSIITFEEFMEKYMMPEAPDANKLGYLAQHDLFSQIPSLRNDIAIPDYCYSTPPDPKVFGSAAASCKPPTPILEEPLLNAWFGPAGTVSPLHTDPYHNILCQVVGKKYVRLYGPDQTDNLYPKGIEEGGVDMSNTSEVDAEAAAEVLNAGFPLFRQAKYVETILNEGECLYIPVGWWHYVRSLSASFSVSFWWN